MSARPNWESDPLERFLGLRDRADLFARQMGSIPNDDKPHVGADSTGFVRVQISSKGVVSGVAIDRDWHSRLAARQLPAAVTQAFNAASVRRLERWGEQFSNATSAEPPPSARPAPVQHDLAGQLSDLAARTGSGQQLEQLLEDLLETLDEAERDLDRVEEQVRSHATTTFDGKSAARHVTATVDGSGELIDIQFDQAWVNRAHEANLSRETAEAIRTAQRRLLDNVASTIGQSSPLEHVRTLHDDPFGLARRSRRGNP